MVEKQMKTFTAGDTKYIINDAEARAEVADLKSGFTKMQTATAEDVGKALKAKTVADGKVTEWEFGDSGGDVTASQNESDKYDLAIADTSGNALVIMQKGHIKTKNFDSAEQTETLNRLSTIETATAEDEGKALIAERISNGRVEEWAFTTPGDATALQTDSEKYEFAIGDEDSNAILSVSKGHIKTKNFDSSLFVIDPTLSSGAADAKTVGYKLRSMYDMLDNIPFIHGVINDTDGKWNGDKAKKNVYYQSFFAVDDYAGIQKAPSDAYSLSIYFYTQNDQATFVKSKTLHNVESYYFSEEDSGYYFRIRVRSTTDSVLDLTTRYVRLFTSRKATVKHKNEDKRNALVASKGKNQNNFSLLVVTDLHGDDVRMFNAISYLNEEDLLDAGACLGDILSQNNTFYTDAVLNAQKDFMTILGNHDVGDGTSITTGRTQQQAFDKFIAPVVTKTGTDTTKAYYYKDYDNKTIRMIILNSSDLPDTLADESNFLVNRGLLGAFSQAQIDWFISTLSGTPTGYHVLILMHYVNAEMTADENLHFHTTSVTWAGRKGNAYVGIINDIVKAWKSGTTLTKNYTSSYENMPTINVNADFTARGTGVFVGFLTGHVHRDVVGHFNDYPDQAACIFTLSNMMRGGEDDMPRVAGEKSEDAMTVVSVDTTNRKLYLVRVGANLAIDFTERADVCISY